MFCQNLSDERLMRDLEGAWLHSPLDFAPVHYVNEQRATTDDRQLPQEAPPR